MKLQVTQKHIDKAVVESRDALKSLNVGGWTSCCAIAQVLREKFPNTKVVVDYEESNSENEAYATVKNGVDYKFRVRRGKKKMKEFDDHITIHKPKPKPFTVELTKVKEGM